MFATEIYRELMGEQEERATVRILIFQDLSIQQKVYPKQTVIYKELESLTKKTKVVFN